MPTEQTPEQRAIGLAIYLNQDFQDKRVMAAILAHDRETAALALEEYAGHVRDTWGQAYAEEFFPNLRERAMKFDDTTRTTCSGFMGRHMAGAIEREVLERAAAIRKGEL